MQKNHPLLGRAQCRVVEPILRCPQICEIDRVSFGLACARRRTAHLQPNAQRCGHDGSIVGVSADEVHGGALRAWGFGRDLSEQLARQRVSEWVSE